MIKTPHLLQVKSMVDITPNLRRITFSGETLSHYPFPCIAAHIKIFIAQPHQQKPVFVSATEIKPDSSERPFARSYSVRNLRPEQNEMDIEFVLHGVDGPASAFALHAKPGDYLGVSTPKEQKSIQSSVNNHYLVADLSALPAMSAILEAMPKQNIGHALLLCSDPTDRLELQKPQGITLHYFDQRHALIDFFKQLPLAKEDVYFWIAGEEKLVVTLRSYIRKEQSYSREQIYAVPFWRSGLNEEYYHQQRHDVMDNL